MRNFSTLLRENAGYAYLNKKPGNYGDPPEN